MPRGSKLTMSNRARTAGPGGFLPLAWSEIDAWARLNGYRLKPWHVEALCLLDDAWLEVAAKKHVAMDDLLPEACA